MIQNLTVKQSEKILEQNYIGNLAYIHQNRPYIAPITYYFSKKENLIIGYSAEGHKINAIRKNHNISLGVTEIEAIDSWKSILVHGIFKELEGSEAKAYLHSFSLGVKDLIMMNEQRKLDFINEFSSKINHGELPIVFTIEIEEITGRLRKK